MYRDKQKNNKEKVGGKDNKQHYANIRKTIKS